MSSKGRHLPCWDSFAIIALHLVLLYISHVLLSDSPPIIALRLVLLSISHILLSDSRSGATPSLSFPFTIYRVTRYKFCVTVRESDRVPRGEKIEFCGTYGRLARRAQQVSAAVYTPYVESHLSSRLFNPHSLWEQ